MHNAMLFEKLRFRPASTRKFSKISTLDRFKKPAFLLLEKRRLPVDERLKRRKEISVFKISGYV